MENLEFDPIVHSELDEIWEYISHRNPPAAEKVYGAIKKSFGFLLKNPFAGPVSFPANDSRNLEGIRIWVVREYPNYLIFYRVLPDGILIHHVLHSSRDVKQVFS